MQRWAFPYVPDANLLPPAGTPGSSNFRIHRHNIYMYGPLRLIACFKKDNPVAAWLRAARDKSNDQVMHAGRAMCGCMRVRTSAMTRCWEPAAPSAKTPMCESIKATIYEKKTDLQGKRDVEGVGGSAA